MDFYNATDMLERSNLSVCVKCSEAKFNQIYIKRVRIRAFDSQSNKDQSALGHILFLFYQLAGQFMKQKQNMV